MQYIIVCGNPISGFNYIGTFNSHEDAFNYADENITKEYDYWIVELDKPEY